MICDEKLFPLAKAVERATGQRPHPSTLYRWRNSGIAGVRLETHRVGGRRMCTLESVRRFLDAVTAAAEGEQPTRQVRTPHQRRLDIGRVEKNLNDLL